MRYAASLAQRRYYQVQARKLDELRTMADGLNAACRIQREGGGNLAKGLRDLDNRTDWARGELRAAVIALNDAIGNNDPDLVVEIREEIERREQAVLEMSARTRRDQHARQKLRHRPTGMDTQGTGS